MVFQQGYDTDLPETFWYVITVKSYLRFPFTLYCYGYKKSI